MFENVTSKRSQLPQDFIQTNLEENVLNKFWEKDDSFEMKDESVATDLIDLKLWSDLVSDKLRHRQRTR